MQPTPASIEPASPLPPAPPDGNDGAHTTARYLEILDRLMATGVEIADDIRRNNRANPANALEASREIDRVARTLRRCMLLARKLQEGRRARSAGAAAAARLRAIIPAAPHPTAPQFTAPQFTAPGPDRLDRIGPGTIPEILAGLARDLEALAAKHAPKTPLPPAAARQIVDETAPPTPAAAEQGRGDGKAVGAQPTHRQRKPICLAGCRTQTSLRVCTPEKPPPRRR